MKSKIKNKNSEENKMKKANFKTGIFISALFILLVLASACEQINPGNNADLNIPETSQQI